MQRGTVSNSLEQCQAVVSNVKTVDHVRHVLKRVVNASTVRVQRVHGKVELDAPTASQRIQVYPIQAEVRANKAAQLDVVSSWAQHAANPQILLDRRRTGTVHLGTTVS